MREGARRGPAARASPATTRRAELRNPGGREIVQRRDEASPHPAAATAALLGLLVAAALAEDVIGTEAGETLNGTAEPDQIYGEGGNDTLVGGAASD